LQVNVQIIVTFELPFNKVPSLHPSYEYYSINMFEVTTAAFQHNMELNKSHP